MRHDIVVHDTGFHVYEGVHEERDPWPRTHVFCCQPREAEAEAKAGVEGFCGATGDWFYAEVTSARGTEMVRREASVMALVIKRCLAFSHV